MRTKILYNGKYPIVVEEGFVYIAGITLGVVVNNTIYITEPKYFFYDKQVKKMTKRGVVFTRDRSLVKLVEDQDQLILQKFRTNVPD